MLDHKTTKHTLGDVRLKAHAQTPNWNEVIKEARLHAEQMAAEYLEGVARANGELRRVIIFTNNGAAPSKSPLGFRIKGVSENINGVLMTEKAAAPCPPPLSAWGHGRRAQQLLTAHVIEDGGQASEAEVTPAPEANSPLDQRGEALAAMSWRAFDPMFASIKWCSELYIITANSIHIDPNQYQILSYSIHKINLDNLVRIFSKSLERCLVQIEPDAKKRKGYMKTMAKRGEAAWNEDAINGCTTYLCKRMGVSSGYPEFGCRLSTTEKHVRAVNMMCREVERAILEEIGEPVREPQPTSDAP